MTYKINHILEYVLMRALVGLVNALPYHGALLLGRMAASVSALFMRGKLRRTARRIKEVFGDTYSDRAVTRIAHVAWRGFICSMVESMRTPRVTLPWIKEHIDSRDMHMVFDNMREGKGVVLAVPHMGNWELAGVATQMLGLKLLIIVRRQKNPLINAYLNRMRSFTGVEALERESRSFAGIIHKLKNGKVLAILPDIRAKSEALTVRFLGVDVSIAGGMALFAREAGVPILPAYVVRTAWDRHAWRGLPPIWPDYSMDKDADIRRMTQYVMDHFDQVIRQYPEQYFWFNNRWLLGEEQKR